MFQAAGDIQFVEVVDTGLDRLVIVAIMRFRNIVLHQNPLNLIVNKRVDNVIPRNAALTDSSSMLFTDIHIFHMDQPVLIAVLPDILH